MDVYKQQQMDHRIAIDLCTFGTAMQQPGAKWLHRLAWTFGIQ